MYSAKERSEKFIDVCHVFSTFVNTPVKYIWINIKLFKAYVISFLTFYFSSSKNSSHIYCIAYQNKEDNFSSNIIFIPFLIDYFFCFFESLMCMIWFMENISLSNQQTHVHQFLHQLCLHLLAPEGILSSRDESFIICFSDICIYKNKQKLNSLVSAFSISNIIGIAFKISIVCWTSKDHYAFCVNKSNTVF